MNTLLRALKVYIDGKISKSVKPQVNSDWDETDSNSASFIKNKPFGSSDTVITINGDRLSLDRSTEEFGGVAFVYDDTNFEKRITERLGSQFEDVDFADTINVSFDLNIDGNGGTLSVEATKGDSFDPEDLSLMFGETQPCAPYMCQVDTLLFLLLIFDNKIIIAMPKFFDADISISDILITMPIGNTKKIDSKFISFPADLEIERSFGIGNSPYESMGDLSIAVGRYSLAGGVSTASFGEENNASGIGSMAIGNRTSTYSEYSLALGYDSFAAIHSDASVVGGVGTISRTPASITHGMYNMYDNMYSEWDYRYYRVGDIVKFEYMYYICIKAHTGSWSNGPTKSNGGQYWEVYKDYNIHVIGNGTDEDNRSNAYTLTKNGDAWFSGDVYVHSNSGTNKDEGSKKLMTEDDLAGIVLLPEVTAADNGKVMMVSNGQWTVGNTADITPVPYAEGVKF